MTLEPASYPRHRFPAEIISYAVWLYHVFSLSLRDVELILAERGIVVTHESIRHWCLKFGSDFARKLRRRRPQPGDTWHLDEVFIRIRGVLHYLWRAVDQHGVVLDILVQDRRNGAAAKRFFKHLLHGLQYKPRRCSATIRMVARIASSRNAPERVEHCLTRMLPAPRRLVNRLRGLRRLSRRDPNRLSCSIGEPAFPSRPGAAPSHGAQRRGLGGAEPPGATRSALFRASMARMASTGPSPK